MDKPTSPPAPLEKISSLRRDRSPERDRLHVRFQDARKSINAVNDAAKEEDDDESQQQQQESQSYPDDKRVSGSNPMNSGAKAARVNIDNEMDRRQNRSGSEGSEGKADQHLRHIEKYTPPKNENNSPLFQNRRLPKRPDSVGADEELKASATSSAEEKQGQSSDRDRPAGGDGGDVNDQPQRNDEDDEEEGSSTAYESPSAKRRKEQAMDELEVNSDEFNEMLASLDEHSRKYYHFFHVREQNPLPHPLMHAVSHLIVLSVCSCWTAFSRAAQ